MEGNHNAGILKDMPKTLHRKVAPVPITIGKEVRSIIPNSSHIAIVYEFIEAGESCAENVE